MVCPKCGKNIPAGETLCRECGYRVEEAPARKAAPRKKKSRPIFTAPLPMRVAFWTAAVLLSVVILSLGIYKGYYWIKSVRLISYYKNHNLTEPMLDEITLNDGRPGRAITFFGEDGDLIYISELRQSYMIVAGVARVEIPDGTWFSIAPDDAESAQVVITPVQIAPSGKRTQLPPIEFTVAAPESPLKILSPSGGFEEIYAANYVISAQVTPGSRVLVDGLDVSDVVDYYGNLEVNVAVYPQGENVISIVVETEHHKQTRRDVIIYREAFEIPMEIKTTFIERSTRNTFTVEGTTDPTAQLVVDTPYEEDSLTMDAEGNFSFKAKFVTIGDNTVVFRATKPGLKDTTIAFTTYYLPSLAEYSRNAWRMDYAQLSKLTETWKGRVFLCRGYFVETLSYNPFIIVWNVGSPDEPKYLVLKNESAATSFETGVSYDAYADVEGQYRWHDKFYPCLIARYIDRTK